MEPDNGVVQIALVGDLFVQRPDPGSVFSNADAFLKQHDIVFGNLESVIADSGEISDAKKGHHRLFMRSDERVVSAYTDAGFNVFSLANNHSEDLGTAGLARCIEVLDSAGVRHAGAGSNITEARRPAIIERNGTQVAFLAYTSVFPSAFAATETRPGVATVRVGTSFEPQPRHSEVPGSPPIIHTHPDQNDIAAMQEDVLHAKQEADVVIVSWHWGLSAATGGASLGRTLEYQKQAAHAAIDAGADVVAGHHADETGAIEVYRDKAIFYSLGRFATEVRKGRTGFTILGRCVLRDGVIQRVSFVPFTVNEDAQPRAVDTESGRPVVDLALDFSAQFDTKLRVARDEVVVWTPTTAQVGAAPGSA